MDHHQIADEQTADKKWDFDQPAEKRRPWSAPNLAVIEASQTENGGMGASDDGKGSGFYLS